MDDIKPINLRYYAVGAVVRLARVQGQMEPAELCGPRGFRASAREAPPRRCAALAPRHTPVSVSLRLVRGSALICSDTYGQCKRA